MGSKAFGDTKTWELTAKSEYRFELDPNSSLAIRLVAGKAEIFGAEIALDHTYLFGSECKAALFTWHGCTIEVTGKPAVEYISDETSMVVYSNLHLAFEQMRIKSQRAAVDTVRSPPKEDGSSIMIDSNQDPPRVMILGQEHSGKTTAVKILVNYAVRAGKEWRPILVNLDPSDGGWTVPGTISACPISGPIQTSTPANPLGSTATSAPTALASSALVPLVYWFGHSEVKRNVPLMERLMRELAEAVQDRMNVDSLSSHSGVIIDTSPVFSSPSITGAAGDTRYAMVKACVEAFRVNVILVVGHEKLTVEMQRLFGSQLNHRVTVVKIPKSGGVVELDDSYHERVQSLQQRTYFYGLPVQLPPSLNDTNVTVGGEVSTELGLSPYSAVIGFDDITIYRIGQESMAPSSALPIGASRAITELQAVQIDPSQPGSGLLHSILAVLSNHESEEGIVNVDIAGFILVQSIDTANRKMTILSPSPGPLVGRKAIIGSFEWQDQ